MTLEWAELATFEIWRIIVFFTAVVGLESSSQNMNQIPHSNIFSQFLLFCKNQKAKGRHLSPNSLSCAHAQVGTWHIRAGEEQRLFGIAPKFTSSWGMIINSIIRKCCPSLISYIGRRLLHILWIIRSIHFLSSVSQNFKMHARKNGVEWGKLINNLHI